MSEQILLDEPTFFPFVGSSMIMAMNRHQNVVDGNCQCSMSLID